MFSLMIELYVKMYFGIAICISSEAAPWTKISNLAKMMLQALGPYLDSER